MYEWMYGGERVVHVGGGKDDVDIGGECECEAEAEEGEAEEGEGDTLAYIVKTDSAAEHFLLGTDSVSDRDGRRVLLDLIKGCVPPVDIAAGEDRGGDQIPEGRRCGGSSPQPARGQTRTCVRWHFAKISGQVAADDGSDAFAAAVAEYGAPAVLAGGESDAIDVSAYGFAVTDSSGGVLSELEALTGQVRAMEERVCVHLSQVSLVEGEGVIEHCDPAGAPSANAVASGVPQQVVPPGGGALATGGYMASVVPPTEEFPGGVEMLPVRHYTPAMPLGPLISAVTCSFQPHGGGALHRAVGHIPLV
ncbi:hypothetical protein CYMTET_6455 [Cymbomonas tetramitiformis]|uniref:Uncharacterized protein n=1 Tax=Cymbomonas tetramitiformis TaxID=36881 RepID=A0AAE0GXE5_9CHLO|nr:hypothetical protein CYMTET_6455 [Cymbomonas tetramitiformis]